MINMIISNDYYTSKLFESFDNPDKFKSWVNDASSNLCSLHTDYKYKSVDIDLLVMELKNQIGRAKECLLERNVRRNK